MLSHFLLPGRESVLQRPAVASWEERMKSFFAPKPSNLSIGHMFQDMSEITDGHLQMSRLVECDLSTEVIQNREDRLG